MLTTPMTEEQMLESVLASLEDATMDDAHFERRMIDAHDRLIEAYRASNPHATDEQRLNWKLLTSRSSRSALPQVRLAGGGRGDADRAA